MGQSWVTSLLAPQLFMSYIFSVTPHFLQKMLQNSGLLQKQQQTPKDTCCPAWSGPARRQPRNPLLLHVDISTQKFCSSNYGLLRTGPFLPEQDLPNFFQTEGQQPTGFPHASEGYRLLFLNACTVSLWTYNSIQQLQRFVGNSSVRRIKPKGWCCITLKTETISN